MVVVEAQVIRALAEIVLGHMAKLVLGLTENQEQIIQPTVVAVEEEVADSMVAPAAEAMGVHMAAGRVKATLAAKQVTRAPAGVSAIQMGSHPMDAYPVGNRVSLFRIM